MITPGLRTGWRHQKGQQPCQTPLEFFILLLKRSWRSLRCVYFTFLNRMWSKRQLLMYCVSELVAVCKCVSKENEHSAKSMAGYKCKVYICACFEVWKIPVRHLNPFFWAKCIFKWRKSLQGRENREREKCHVTETLQHCSAQLLQSITAHVHSAATSHSGLGHYQLPCFCLTEKLFSVKHKMS